MIAKEQIVAQLSIYSKWWNTQFLYCSYIDVSQSSTIITFIADITTKERVGIIWCEWVFSLNCAISAFEKTIIAKNSNFINLLHRHLDYAICLASSFSIKAIVIYVFCLLKNNALRRPD